MSVTSALTNGGRPRQVLTFKGVGFLKQLRMFAVTVAAAISGVITLLLGRGDRHPLELKQGDLAPDFDLVGSDGRRYRLRDFRHRDAVVVAWFPKAFTPGCTRQCESLGSSHTALRGFNATYFGASVDPADTNRQFAESLGIDYPILSDPSKAVARAYGVLGAAGFPVRWTFYIGPDGRILDVDKHVRPGSFGPDVVGKLTALGVPPAQA